MGLRFDGFNADVTNNRTATDFTSDDGLLAPRLGLIYKPLAPLSVYGSYSLTYLPRAGRQLSSLSLTNQTLDRGVPQLRSRREVGRQSVPSHSRWPCIVTDRGNVIVPSPTDPALSSLVDAQVLSGTVE